VTLVFNLVAAASSLHQTHHYHLSLRSSPLFGQYRIILLGDRGTKVPKVVAQQCPTGTQTCNLDITSLTPSSLHHCATHIVVADAPSLHHCATQVVVAADIRECRVNDVINYCYSLQVERTHHPASDGGRPRSILE